MSGENRGELENILKHYQNNPKQLTASQFLIRNMKSCFSGFFRMVYQIRSIIFLYLIDRMNRSHFRLRIQERHSGPLEGAL